VNPGGGGAAYGAWAGAATSERYSSARTGVGIANAWTVSFWTGTVSLAADSTYADIGPSSGDVNRLKFMIQGSVAGDPYNVKLYGTDGILFKEYNVTGLFLNTGTGQWQHLAATWDGTTLTLYRNGSPLTPTTAPTDNAGTMDDSNARVIACNCDTTGADVPSGVSTHSLAIWNEALTAAEIASLYNHGAPGYANLNGSFMEYTSASNLRHWYRLGLNLADMGADYADAANPRINLSLGTMTVTSLPAVASSTSVFPAGGGLELASGQNYQSATQAVGIANEWSIGFWGKSDIASNEDRFITIQASASTVNQIILSHRTDLANEPMQVSIANSAGTVFKNYLWNWVNLHDTNNSNNGMEHVIVTWDGTTLRLFRDGVEWSPNTRTTDNSGTQTDTARRITWFAADNLGVDLSSSCFHSGFVWNKALRPEEINFLFNGFNPFVDLGVDQYKYNSSQYLKYWWKMSHPYGGTFGDGDETCSNRVPNPTGLDITSGLSSIDAINDVMTGQQFFGAPCVRPIGDGDYLRTKTASTLGIANTWSLMLSGLIRNLTSGIPSCFIDIKGSDDANRIQVNHVDDVTDYLEIKLWDSAGALFKEYRYTGFSFSIQQTELFVITWDGTTLTLHKNGVTVASSSTPTNNAGTMIDTARVVYVGVAGDAIDATTANLWWSEVALWNVAVTLNQHRQMYLERPGFTDRRKNAGMYTCADSIKHWWILGGGDDRSMDNIGRDYVLYEAPLHMQAVNLDYWRITSLR